MILCQRRNRAPIVNIEDLDEILSTVRNKKKTVVFTNGCFDILHPGHLQVLEKAKEFGDFLIVGVNSDASIKRLKGFSRPIQPLVSRLALLSSLRVVDCLISFSEDTPIVLIEKIMPDVLVKGGDYRADQIVGAQAVTRNGGRVEVVPLVQGYSTTSIAEKMRS